MKRSLLLISCAWLVHAAAWLLPVFDGGVTLPKGLPGWEAFRWASSAVWPFGPLEDGKFATWYYAALATVSAGTTLLFIFGSPWVVLRGSRSLWRASAWAAATAFVVNAHWYVLYGPDRSGLRIGYFLWWLSFALLAIGLFALAGSRRADEAQKGPPVRRRVRLICITVITALVLALGFFYLRCSLRQTREATLKLDLFTIRIAIENYTLDKDQGPKSLQDLVSGHYLKEIPTDPFTHKKDWVSDADPDLHADQTVPEMVSVHSASDQVGCNGMAYNSW